MIEEVADLMDHGELRVLAKPAEVQAKWLAGSITPIVGSSLRGSAGSDDGQLRQVTIAVNGVDGGQRAPYGIERGSRRDDQAAADRGATRRLRPVALLHDRSRRSEEQDGLGVAGGLPVGRREAC